MSVAKEKREGKHSCSSIWLTKWFKQPWKKTIEIFFYTCFCLGVFFDTKEICVKFIWWFNLHFYFHFKLVFYQFGSHKDSIVGDVSFPSQSCCVGCNHPHTISDFTIWKRISVQFDIYSKTLKYFREVVFYSIATIYLKNLCRKIYS